MRSIFFLDDSAEFLEVMKVFIENISTCSAITASNFEYMLAQEELILKSDMAFLDINLGLHQPSGVQAYRWLRSLGYNKPVFFLTGHAIDSDETKEAHTFEGTKILRKPISPQELLQLIGSQS
ncbi:hypothetical protein CIK05_01910 [Bdellovibrio sp. qaytius]|nr:hypothetical protein CIK05_01910 [Bdellovibrio sp. qaytius]